MSSEVCNVCGKSAEEGEEFTYLKLYINGSEGTNACEDCRMDITNFTRNLASSLGRQKLRTMKQKKGLTTPFPGMPFERIKEQQGFGELIKFSGVAHVVGIEGINANGDVISPEAVFKAVIGDGRLETSKGEEFRWDEEADSWREVAAGHPRALRAFSAGPMGFPEEDLGWSWKPEAMETGHITLNKGRLIFAGTLKEEDEQAED